MKANLQQEGEKGVGLVSTGFFDQEIYGGSDSRFAGYVTSIAANEQEEVSFVFVFFYLFPHTQCHLNGAFFNLWIMFVISNLEY